MSSKSSKKNANKEDILVTYYLFINSNCIIIFSNNLFVIKQQE